MPQTPVSYDADIKPLFTPTDQQHMAFMLDLWSFGDVRSNADAIYNSLAGGTMPPPPRGPWPAEKVELFQKWIKDGCQP